MFRDLLVNNAVTNSTTTFGGVTYSNTAQNITGLISPGSNGVNHGKNFHHVDRDGASLTLHEGIAIDGIVTLLTVIIV